LAACLQGLGKTGEAMSAVSRAVELAPSYSEAISYLGNLLYDNGEPRKAAQLWLRIPLLEHGDPATLKRLISHCGKTRALRGRVPALRARLKEILSGRGNGEFLRRIGAGGPAASPAAETPKADAPRKRFLRQMDNGFIRALPEAGVLDTLESLIGLIYGEPRPAYAGQRMPAPGHSDNGALGRFLASYHALFRGMARNAGAADGEPRHWGATWIIPYAIPLIPRCFSGGACQWEQKDAEGLLESHLSFYWKTGLNCEKWECGHKALDRKYHNLRENLRTDCPENLSLPGASLPPAFRFDWKEWPDCNDRLWVLVAGATIAAFWGHGELVERLPEIARGFDPALQMRRFYDEVSKRACAWLRWFDFGRAPRPGEPDLFRIPQDLSSRPCVFCMDCGHAIPDYWAVRSHLEGTVDVYPARCRDCGPFVQRCRKCLAPMREYIGGGAPVHSFRCSGCGAAQAER
jgi:hypothetical protein